MESTKVIQAFGNDEEKLFSYMIEDIPNSFPPSFHVQITTGKLKDKRAVFYEMPQELAYFYNLNENSKKS